MKLQAIFTYLKCCQVDAGLLLFRSFKGRKFPVTRGYAKMETIWGTRMLEPSQDGNVWHQGGREFPITESAHWFQLRIRRKHQNKFRPSSLTAMVINGYLASGHVLLVSPTFVGCGEVVGLGNGERELDIKGKWQRKGTVLHSFSWKAQLLNSQDSELKTVTLILILLHMHGIFHLLWELITTNSITQENEFHVNNDWLQITLHNIIH